MGRSSFLRNNIQSVNTGVSSSTFLLKSFVSNRGCGLSVRTPGHHFINLHILEYFCAKWPTVS